MPNIDGILKGEIQRLARHEIKVSMEGLQEENSALKRTVADLERRFIKLESINTRRPQSLL